MLIILLVDVSFVPRIIYYLVLLPFVLLFSPFSPSSIVGATFPFQALVTVFAELRQGLGQPYDSSLSGLVLLRQNLD
jgi:hypothetical protein